MTRVETIADGVTLYLGDCMAVLPQLDADSVDSCVTDPPYHLTSIVKRFGAENAAPVKKDKTGAYKRTSAGFMGKQWDGGEIAFEPETWAEVYRVLKPGGHLLAFGAPKNFGFMQVAMAKAGFEIRDVLCWVFGSGFPKSHNISKGMDKAAGAKGSFGDAKTLAHQRYIDTGELRGDRGHDGWQRPWMDDPEAVANAGRQYIPATEAAKQWDGWGTALKPAYEPIILARKPLSEGTVAANVLKHGTGALNIDGCRVGVRERPKVTDPKRTSNTYGAIDSPGGKLLPDARWPANVIHDGSEEVVGAFPQAHVNAPGQRSEAVGLYEGGWGERKPFGYDTEGSAARFFYSAKADADDRLGSKHPTVKPLDLMQYLVRLVTPKGGLVLDLFAGTGTTGEAAIREGMRAILIEREEEYQEDIRRRMRLAMAGPDERVREAMKAKLKDTPPDHGPLFADLWKEPYWNEDGTAPVKA